MENVNVFPMIYKHRINSAGEVPLVICITLNNKPVAYEPMHRKIKLSDWNADEKKTKSDDLLNLLLDKRKAEIKNQFTRAQLLDHKLTKRKIKSIIAGDDMQKDFIEYADHIIATKKLADGNGYSEDTKRRYTDETARLKQFKNEIYFSDVTAEFLHGYKQWLINTYRKKDNTKLHQNSIWKTFSFLRMVWKQAIKDQIIKDTDNPFKVFEVGSYEQDTSKIKYLELAQIESIEYILINSSDIDELTRKIGWRFLVMCVCGGMRISDAMRLNDGFINDAGHLTFKPHKTRRYNNQADIPIVSDRQRRYLLKTMEHPLEEKDPKSFRTIFNDHLKIIALLAGIKINLTSHVGRHTMGSFLVDGDVEEAAAKKILGIKSNKVLDTYRHLKQSKLLSEANKLNSIF